MAENVYNSAFTGAQIDEVISDVRNNKSKWNQAVTDAENLLPVSPSLEDGSFER